jgi:hydrogenase-4 component H
MVLSWVRRGLRTGVVTTRYPAIPEQVSPHFRGRPTLDPERCLAGEGCTACVQVCLPGALHLVKQHPQINADGAESQVHLTLDLARCVLCDLCVATCPAGALRMTNEYELATSDREALRVTAIFTPTHDSAQENGKEGTHGPSA